jgi:Ferritin-like
MADAEWTLDALREHLTGAVELELLTIPPYLCALYSIHPQKNLEAGLIIRSVVVEEMLHMILAANVLNAVGGKPNLTSGEFMPPRYPTTIPYHAGRLEVGLRPLDEDALSTFLSIENPSYLARVPLKPTAGAAQPRIMSLGYETIGDFYDAVERALVELVLEHGEDKVFIGDHSLQIGPEHYYASGGHAIKVHELSDAIDALEQIVEQGEGKITKPPSGEKFDPERDLAHFYRFNELATGRRYQVDDVPEAPTGPPIEFDEHAIYNMKPNLKTAELPTALREASDDCNVVWSGLLRDLEDALNGQPKLLRSAVVTMFAFKDAAGTLLAVELHDVAAPPGEPPYHAGPTFEYVPAPDPVPDGG